MIPAPRLMILAVAGLLLAAMPVVYLPQLWVAVVVLWTVLAVGCLVDGLVLWHARPTLAVDAPAHVGDAALANEVLQ